MIYDMTVSLSLFKDHVTEVSWIHECMCHFFAACYVRMDQEKVRSILLSDFYKSQNLAGYREMLKQYSEIEPVEFRKFIMTLLLKEMLKYYAQSMASAKQGLLNNSVEARCYLLFKSDVHFEISNGIFQLYHEEKDKTFILELLYRQFKQSFSTMAVEDVMHEDLASVNLTRQKMRINSLSGTQKDYDYANAKVAEETVDNYHYLPLSVVSDILSQLESEELLSEDTNLLNNI